MLGELQWSKPRVGGEKQREGGRDALTLRLQAIRYFHFSLQDRDLVLQRIAEDRQQVQEKVQSIAPHRDAASRSKECVAPDTGCALMVCLPSGSSVRLQFASDALLQSVCEHLDSTQPSLAPCSLLQTFPTRHFTEQDLRSSLQELGLTPNATLRVRPREKPCLMPQPEPVPDPSPEAMDTLCSPDDLLSQGNQLLPIMRSPAHSVVPGVQMRDVPPLSQPHAWGRGQRLDRQDRDEAGGDAAAVGGIDLGPVVSRAVGSLSHQWPSDGVRLRPSDQSNESGTPGSESAEPDPPNLRARMAAELRQESPEKVPSVSRGVRVSPIPSLRHLALQEAIILINDQGVSVVRFLHKLQYLNVSSCRKLTDSCLPFLLGLEHLSHLVLDQTKVSDDGLCDFLLQSCGSLTHLSVNQTSVTERTISLLSQRVPELKLLSIKHTQVLISNAGRCHTRVLISQC
uniref:UBX domain-containing protein 4 n=1 Tax=Leptobrachium leishanense TaxID=445787 RepID=A0A8C5QE03_9ANUR